MALLNKDQILAAQDLETEEVPVPEWGGRVRVRMMTAGERDDYEAAFIAASESDTEATKRRLRARLLAWTIVDEAGQRLFSEADIEALAAKGVRAVQRVYNAASKLNALTPRDVDQLAKNSAATPDASTASS